MIIIWLLFLIVLVFCLTGIFLGAPYLPTLSKQVESALKLADLKKGQTLIELGCGDGKVLIAAAQKGVYSIGYEINPVLVVIAKLRSMKYRNYIKVIWGNYWRISWPKADVVFVFLIDRYMAKLDNRLKSYEHKPIKLVSFAFKIPDKSVVAELGGVYLYRYN